MATHKIILGRIGKNDQKGEVQMMIIHERKHREINIGFRVHADDFVGGRIRKAHPQANKMNQKIAAAIKAADDVIVDHAGEFMPIDQLVHHIMGQMKYDGKSPLYAQLIPVMRDEYKANDQNSTARQFEWMAEHFKDFAGETLLVHQITTELLNRYKRHLMQKKLSDNTIFSYLTTVKMVWKRAVKDGYISKLKDSPFTRELMPGRPKGRKKAQSADTIRIMEERRHELPVRHRHAIESRLLQYYLQGLDFIDIARLRKSKIENDYTTLPYRYKNRKKKDKTEITIKIHPKAYEIINQHQGDAFLPMFEPFTENTLDSEEFESLRSTVWYHVKSACEKLGIADNMGSKVVRHTWATHADKASNRDFLLTKMSLGHKIDDMTATYIHVDQAEIDQLNERLINGINPDKRK